MNQRSLALDTITAPGVVELLRAKHSGDVFIAECKNGPTHYVEPGGMVRMDAWAMPRSWAHPAVTAYEVKISRSDFLNDTKWPKYLDLCNLLYFVAPRGVVNKEEVPESCGLLEVSKNAKRLITRKKAPHRDVEIPEDLWRYILMCRSNIVDERDPEQSNAEQWRVWLAQKRKDQETGWLAGRRIEELVEARVADVQAENERMKQQVECYSEVAEVMKEAGISDRRAFNAKYAAERELMGRVTKDLIYPLNAARRALELALEKLTPPDQGAA